MDMSTRTDKMIAAAIAGLPYRRPSAGFKARVMAAVAAQAAADERLAWVLKAAGSMTAAWAALVTLVSAGPAWRLVSDYAAAAAEPGGLAQMGKLFAARLALLPAKVSAAVSFAADIAGIALAHMPPAYEIGAAALISAAVIRAVARRPAAQGI